jgi:hypothetical protein
MIKHIYIPIIKGKQNDLKAIGKLHPNHRKLIKPLIELSPTPSKSNVDDHLEKFIKYLTAQNDDGLLFVDFNGFIPGESTKKGIPATIAGYDYLHNVECYVTPVYGFGRDDSLWNYLGAVIKQHRQGFCFRLEEDDLEEDIAEETWEKILIKSAQLEVSFTEVDLIIDLKDVRLKSVSEKVSLVTDFMMFQPKSIKFRSIAIAGSSAPKDVSVIKIDSIGEIERKELMIWANLRTDLVVNGGVKGYQIAREECTS